MTETNESVGLDCQYCDDDIEMTDVTGHYSGVCKKCRQKIDKEQSAFGTIDDGFGQPSQAGDTRESLNRAVY